MSNTLVIMQRVALASATALLAACAGIRAAKSPELSATAYRAHLECLSSDECAAGRDVSGTLQDFALYYAVGLAIANESSWPDGRSGSEFRAIRDASRAQ